MPLKFIIETYGCQMNTADSELVSSILISSGYEKTLDISQSDIIIFNTCSVRQHAENRVLGRISNETKRKKDKPHLKIGVIGCMAQRIGQELLESNLSIDFVSGVDQYLHLPAIINATYENALDFDCEQVYKGVRPLFSDNVCCFVTIMRGCNNYCSYCIVPYVRGRERSRSLDEILNEVTIALDKGIKDITLLGQNVNSYKYKDITFPKLLKAMNSMNYNYRIRFVTSHPKDLSDDLIDSMAQSDKVCEHIHLPMQSGDNEVLKSMNRNYTIEQYFRLIDKLKSSIPNIAITTDIIAGFPGENETQFNHTLDAMNRICFDYAFCFKYSDREGTKAYDFDKKVEEEIRLQRLQKLIAMQRKHTKLKFQSQIGKTVQVLVEGKSKQGGKQLSGKTRDFKICVFEGNENQIGCFVKVEVTDATPGTLICHQTRE